jgi:predicted nucleic acid-binding protein
LQERRNDDVGIENGADHEPGYVNAVKTGGLETPTARNVVELLAHWQPVGPSTMLIRRAWSWMDQAGISYWDGLILSAAEQFGCAWLLSEDFRPGGNTARQRL